MRENPVASRRRHGVSVLLEALVFGTLVLAAGSRALKGGAHPAPGAAPPPLTVDVESDPPARLELLPGIGPARAAAIRSEREAGGPFGQPEGLERVRGIGPETVRGILMAREVRPRFGDR